MMKRNKAEQYAEDVRSGRVLAGLHVKNAVERYYRDLDNALDKGWYLDRAAGEKAIKFIERLKHTKGKWDGQYLILEPWQHFIIYNLFAWKRSDGMRRFRYAYIEVARKNGKTALAAGIALLMLYLDGEPRAEVYSVATSKDQARLAFEDAKSIVKKTDLSKRMQVYTNSIAYEQKGSFFKALSSDSGIHDGLNPHCTIVDEFHAHPHSGMFDVMKSAIGARSQPLIFIITTAGFNKNGPCYAYRRNAMNIAAGIVEDDSLFTMIFTLDKGDAWDDPAVWGKANPNLGISVDLDYVTDQVTDAKNRPEALRNVKTKNINLWVDAETTWILDDKWMQCVGTTPEDELEDCECWGGLDLSNVSDITAFALTFKQNEKVQHKCWFWIPEETMQVKIEKENINYAAWVEEGYVKVTPGNVTDYDFVKADILAICEKYQVKSIAYDRWNSSQTIIDLTNEGLIFSPFGQGYGSMSAPSKQFENNILTAKAEHFGNPVLRWMMASTSVSTDPAGNIKPDKRKSSQKIDGIVACIMSLGEMMTQETEKETNPYEHRGLRTL